MPAYDNWTEKVLLVSNLMLDVLNPRIPSLREDMTQREIVAELIEHEEVLELAKRIARLGFFPTERLIAIEESVDTIVVEGNRRLAALKLLVTPAFAPEGWEKKFAALQSRINVKDFHKVRVVIAPSREAAAPLIIDRHTHPGVERWQPTQQAKYLRMLVKPGANLDVTSETYGIPRGELVSALRADTMYKIACQLELDDEVKTVVTNPRRFNATTLDRVMQSRTAQGYLGIKFDRDGKLIGSVAPEEFKKAYKRVVSDLARNSVDSRTLNDNASIGKYFEKFGKQLPDKSKKGSFDAESILGSSASSNTPAAVAKKSSATQRLSPTLIPSHVKCQITDPKVIAVYRELRKLRIKDYENSSAVMLRVFLELLLSSYLDRTGKIAPLLEKAKNDGRKADWYPTLRQMFRKTLEDSDLSLPPLARRALKQMADDGQGVLSVESMDQYVHNRYVVPTERELRAAWTKLEPLVELLLAKAPSA